ncbi:MAG: hypothetical protein K2W82_13030 [Candidatus Obscuribacterales bacterium]|nr:hypothetical protein [Candidatus Obscuribacterales bacterium]
MTTECPPLESPVDTKENSAFEIPGPLLTISQAAAALGKSIRAIERSIVGRWGNRLPEGWSARKVTTERGQEWRILPPASYRVRQATATKTEANEKELKNDLPATRYETFDQPTIIIDRSDEVEHLLRELLSCQKSLSEERRLRFEDMRQLTQLQSTMRLLEVDKVDNERLKNELEKTKTELGELTKQYNHMVNLPWWKKLFTTI